MEVPVFPVGEYVGFIQIGLGGYSRVVKVTKVETGEDFVLKIAQAKEEGKTEAQFEAETAKAVQNLKYEAEIGRILTGEKCGSQLSGKELQNIVCVRDLYSYNGQTALLEEFVPGLPLNRYIEHRIFNPEKLETPIKYFVQLLEGVCYMHSCGVVHRDIKPHNLILHNGQIKIIDLGLAVSLGVNPNRLNMQGGTPNYAGPEIWDFNKYKGLTTTEKLELFMKADAYACGVVGYQLFWNKHPLKGVKTRQEAGKIVKQGRIQIPKEPRHLSALISLMLEKDYTQRASISLILQIMYGNSRYGVTGNSLCLLLDAFPKEVSRQVVVRVFSFL